MLKPLLLIAFIAVNLLLDTDATKADIEELQRRLMPIKTVQTRFTQTRTMSLLKIKLTFHGELVCAPGLKRLLFRVDRPVPSAILLNSGVLTQWDGSSGKTVTLTPTTAPWITIFQDQICEWFSGNLLALQRQAAIEFVSKHHVRLTPKSGVMHKLAKAIDLHFAPDFHAVERVVMHERTGDTVEFLFHDTVINNAIPPETWVIPPVKK